MTVADFLDRIVTNVSISVFNEAIERGETCEKAIEEACEATGKALSVALEELGLLGKEV